MSRVLQIDALDGAGDPSHPVGWDANAAQIVLTDAGTVIPGVVAADIVRSRRMTLQTALGRTPTTIELFDSLVGYSNGYLLCRELTSTAPMYALTVRQPWASLIITGAKATEHRQWRTRHRGRLAIHAAAKRATRTALKQHGYRLDDNLPRGAVLGTVEVVDCMRVGKEWHWVLTNPVAFDTPIPARGHQALWHWQLPH